MPLRDIAGSTIALVKPGQTDSQPPTLYSYDPFGVPRLTGAGSSWPFLYQGMEHEITDPAPLYFDQGANVYNPMLQRELSRLGQQGIAGPPTAGAGDGGMNGFGGFGPSQSFGNPGGLSGGQIASNLLTVAQAPLLFGQGGIGIGEAGPLPIPGLGVSNVIDVLSELFGGNDNEVPRQKEHAIHPIYLTVLGLSKGQVVSQQQAECPCPTAPVLPKGSVDDNIRAAKKYGRVYFAEKVWPGHEWDFKRYSGGWQKWDYAGNFNYGAAGKAAGFSEKTLLSFGGMLQICNGTSTLAYGIPFLTDPYGERKAWEIRQGERYYDCGCYERVPQQ